MKKLIGLMAVTLLLLSGPLSAQKILLKIAAITPAAGEDVKAVELKIETSTSWQQGGGASVGKAVFQNLLLKKSNSTSSNELYRRMLVGSAIPAVVLEYYDASNVMYFSITMRSVFVSNFYWLSAECPTCIERQSSEQAQQD